MSSSDEPPPLAIRGQMPAINRAMQTERLTKHTDSPIKAEILGPKPWSPRKVNSLAVRPGLHASSGPQPFISKGRVKNPSMELPEPLTSKQRKAHATSSNNSTGVSFSLINGKESSGYRSQMSFTKAQFSKLQGKSFITSTATDLMQTNEHSSGNETELLAQGHRHVGDASMMQHTLYKKSGKFHLRSRLWNTQEDNQGWGEYGRTNSFNNLSDAFERMYTRGTHGVTHFDDLDEL